MLMLRRDSGTRLQEAAARPASRPSQESPGWPAAPAWARLARLRGRGRAKAYPHARRPSGPSRTVWSMDVEPNLAHLQRLAANRGQVIIKAPNDDLYVLVKPDNAGKGTDPRGELGAALAFRDGVGMPLADVADLLEDRAF